MVRRAAFTFIELIFAIIIIGISVISLPTMIAATSKGIDENIIQEAIFLASAQLNQAISANWDENSLVEGGANSLARVIDDGTCENNSSHPRYRLKPGHIAQPYHRRCLDSNTTGISNASATTVDALEDYSGTKTLTNAAATQAGYKHEYTTNIAVTTNANFNGNNTNIKMIQAGITYSGSANALVLLRTYSANVGEPDYYSREY